MEKNAYVLRIICIRFLEKEKMYLETIWAIFNKLDRKIDRKINKYITEVIYLFILIQVANSFITNVFLFDSYCV